MTHDLHTIGEIFGLVGKTAVVTGGATGIGRETAELFALAGARVAVLDINTAAAAQTVDNIEARGGTAVAIEMDQSDPASIHAAFRAAEAEFGRVDVLLNCAAIYPRVPFEEATAEFLDRMHAINVRGVFICTQEAVKRMKASGGGSIINISSVTSLKAGIFDNVQYGMSKSALNALTTSLALEYAEHAIRVNAVLPGGVATEAAIASTQVGPPLRGPFLQPGRIPLDGGNAAPREIATCCLFLASDASRFVTGQLVAVDGGFLVS